MSGVLLGEVTGDGGNGRVREGISSLLSPPHSRPGGG